MESAPNNRLVEIEREPSSGQPNVMRESFRKVIGGGTVDATAVSESSLIDPSYVSSKIRWTSISTAPATSMSWTEPRAEHPAR